ncbi:hypothetical protein [Candidatus Villigracilis affinis]|nr:hypothetical protein [Anaerolineales bacterium]
MDLFTQSSASPKELRGYATEMERGKRTSRNEAVTCPYRGAIPTARRNHW